MTWDTTSEVIDAAAFASARLVAETAPAWS